MKKKEIDIKWDTKLPHGDWIISNETIKDNCVIYFPKTIKEFVEFNQIHGGFLKWNPYKDEIKLIDRSVWNEKYAMKPEIKDEIKPNIKRSKKIINKIYGKNKK